MVLLNDLDITANSCRTVVDMLQYIQAMCCFPGSANATEPNTRNRVSVYFARHLFSVIYMILLKPQVKTIGVMSDIYSCMFVYIRHRWTCICSHRWPLYITQYRMETLHYVMMTSSNENISALLAICAGNSPVTGEFPAQRPVTRSYDAYFDLRLNKRLGKQSWGWWLRRHHSHYDVTVMYFPVSRISDV